MNDPSHGLGSELAQQCSAEIREEAAEHGPSAYATKASPFELDRLRELVTWLEEEHGPVMESECEAVRDELGDLDIEHARRTAGRDPSRGAA